ncbi:hypothetical protein BJP36_32765 [Moorena producens JHB]|uniref:Uncharacterized protein n=1 Tax=Moorena producens (strain JHB) TaxID=1454205 RepID=A0A1D9G8V5_MOOP1|nr:hypothetical protein [Moorena producens]AOY83991.2 hypothetical protein BJP36_32765 [Moorena producens JHB]
MPELIEAKSSRKRSIILAMIVARILDTRSKFATARGLNKETFFSSLSKLLGLEYASEDELYEALDWLLARQESLENKLAKKHLSEGSLAGLKL